MMSEMAIDREVLVRASDGLLASAAATGFRGADPYDGLWVRWPRILVGGRRRRQTVAQAHARSPVDFRPLYRRDHPFIPKAAGAFGSVALRLHRLTGHEVHRQFADKALEPLLSDTFAGRDAWGYHWDVQTRWSFYPAGTPNVVVTSFAAAALLESGRADMRARAVGAARWVAERLWNRGGGFFAYHPGSRVDIHNASLLGAWLVHEALGDDPGVRDRVATAVERVLEAQLDNGSWPYGAGPELGWTDSFHSGYVLTCLARLRALDPPRVDEALRRGTDYYHGFFGPEGRARLWRTRAYPEDAHSAGTALTTLAELRRAGIEPDDDLLDAVARRVMDCVVVRGRAVHRRYRWGPTRVRYVRWCDAHVALGLVDAARRPVERSVRSSPPLRATTSA